MPIHNYRTSGKGGLLVTQTCDVIKQSRIEPSIKDSVTMFELKDINGKVTMLSACTNEHWVFMDTTGRNNIVKTPHAYLED